MTAHHRFPRMHELTHEMAPFETWPDIPRCVDADPEMFFPAKGEPGTAARELCAACPVRTECLTWALEQGEPFGIWGGIGERERRRLRARAERNAA